VCSSSAPPSMECLQCVLGVVEGAAGPPLCPESATACGADVDCAPLLDCSANCPGTVID
jgi:hypothetical protein